MTQDEKVQEICCTVVCIVNIVLNTKGFIKGVEFMLGVPGKVWSQLKKRNAKWYSDFKKVWLFLTKLDLLYNVIQQSHS